MASLGSSTRSAARDTSSAYSRLPIRWRLAGGSAALTLVILCGFAAIVGVLTTRQIQQEFSRRVSPQRRAKRTWAAGLPERPGVYLFVAEYDEQRHVLYVGKSVNIRTRVRTYFTAAEKRPRIDEMVRLATGVEAVPCLTPLQADHMVRPGRVR